MRLRTSFFETLKASIEQSAPLWVLYSLMPDPWDMQNWEEKLGLGGKNHAVKEILL